MASPRTIVVMAAVALAFAACSKAPEPGAATAGPSSAPAASASSPIASGDVLLDGHFAVGDTELWLECWGSGSPTVVFESGLGGSSSGWAGIVRDLAGSVRACRYDRAGLGLSKAHLDAADVSVGDRAADLHELLQVAGVPGPYVLVGFSFGGLLIRAFANDFGAEAAGLVFLDASHEDQFIPGSYWLVEQPIWNDGPRKVDMATSRAQLLEAGDLGDRPVVVLTNGRMSGEIERQWTPLQDSIAALSSNSLHMVAIDSGHDIPADKPDLVLESVEAVIAAVRDASAVPGCGPRFESLGGECLAGTMGELLAYWDAVRASVVPAAGDLPAGTYTFAEDGGTFEIVVAGGHLDVSMHWSDGSTEALTADYAASGNEIVIRWPFDFRIPRTSGVNSATWTVDADGTLHFVQIDDEAHESWLAVPWAPVAPEPS